MQSSITVDSNLQSAISRDSKEGFAGCKTGTFILSTTFGETPRSFSRIQFQFRFRFQFKTQDTALPFGADITYDGGSLNDPNKDHNSVSFSCVPLPSHDAAPLPFSPSAMVASLHDHGPDCHPVNKIGSGKGNSPQHVITENDGLAKALNPEGRVVFPVCVSECRLEEALNPDTREVTSTSTPHVSCSVRNNGNWEDALSSEVNASAD